MDGTQRATLIATGLVSVSAVDARRATVVATGGRVFVTADGGQTWTAQ